MAHSKNGHRSVNRRVIPWLGLFALVVSRAVAADDSRCVVDQPDLKQALEKEEHVLQFLDQTVYDLIPEHLQLFIFGVVWSGLWREKKRRDMQVSIQRMITAYETKPEIRTSLDTFIASCDSMDSLLAKIKTVSIPGLSIQ